MTVNREHYVMVRDHFKGLLGNECCICGSVFNLEFHHKAKLNSGEGRGRTARMWEWYEAYSKSNLSLLCHTCHVDVHRKR